MLAQTKHFEELSCYISVMMSKLLHRTILSPVLFLHFTAKNKIQFHFFVIEFTHSAETIMFWFITVNRRSILSLILRAEHDFQVRLCFASWNKETQTRDIFLLRCSRCDLSYKSKHIHGTSPKHSFRESIGRRNNWMMLCTVLFLLLLF